MGMPLEGIRVLDVTLFQQGPSATTYLADLGAEVIKVEDPIHGDPGRGVQGLLGSVMDGTATTGLNYYFESHNRNKKGIAVNLKVPAGRQVIYRLVEKCDVFAFNYRRQAMSRLGLDYATLSKHNPKLIYACASGYGPRGPDKDKPAVDGIGQARSGLMALVTEPGRPPTDAGLGTIDQLGGVMLAFGVVTALLVRERTGIGQEVDASLLGSAISIQSMWFLSYFLAGTSPTKVPREEARNPFINSYRGSDGRWLHIAVPNSTNIWPGFCRALGIEELKEHPDFITHEKRLENHQRLIHILDQIFATAPAKVWVPRLQAEGVICDLVCTYADVATDPHAWANDYLVEVDHPAAGRIKQVGLPITFSQTPAKVRTGAPFLGQHTEEVLIEVAGYSWDELAELKSQGAII